jgi:threonine aldolase
LAEDHAHAQQLAETIQQLEGLRLDPPQVDTNIVYFRVDPWLGTATEFCDRLVQRGLRLLPLDRQRVRAVTHLDVDAIAIQRASEALVEAVQQSRASGV